MLIILGGQGLLVWGAQYLSSGMTALLNSTIPLWVAIIALLVFRQRLGWKNGIGIDCWICGTSDTYKSIFWKYSS